MTSADRLPSSFVSDALRVRIIIIGVALAGATGASSASADSGAATVPSTSPAGQQPLSDERAETRWAYPTRRAAVYTRPTGSARRLTRLHLMTEDRFPEVYLLLARWVDDSGNAWVRVRLPMRPNGRKGWVRENALGRPNVVRTRIEINRRTLRLTVYDSDEVVLRARVGVGASSTPTPAGRFWVREKFRVTGAPVYGTHAIGTSAYAPTLSDWPGGGVVGLHGTNQPGLIPGRPSHGCIRLRNRDIVRLARLMPVGTPLTVR